MCQQRTSCGRGGLRWGVILRSPPQGCDWQPLQLLALNHVTLLLRIAMGDAVFITLRTFFRYFIIRSFFPLAGEGGVSLRLPPFSPVVVVEDGSPRPA